MDTPTTVRREIEYNRQWIDANPVLFAKFLHQWHQETEQLGLTQKRINQSRVGTIIYTAEREETAQ